MTVTPVDAAARQVSYTVEVPAPADELFALAADPHRHHELDGSGTVRAAVKGPHRLAEGDRFSVNMKMYGVPYRITSKVTRLVDGRVVEWQHPVGHRWRWEFEPTATGTRVTETWDYSGVNAATAKVFELMRTPQTNAKGIRRTLEKLAAR